MADLYAGYEQLKFDRPHPRVLRIRLSNPARKNAMTETMHGEAARVWRDVDADPDTSAVIITGEGDAFSSGGDREMIRKVIDDFHVRTRVWKEARDIVYNMINCSKPIVSAIRGPAYGAGLACALLADISIAAKDAILVDGHTRMGVAAGDHAVIIWPLLCGMAKAKYYLLTCDLLTGEEAERIGLISLTTDDANLDALALATATRLAEGPPHALRWTKYALNNWLRSAGPSFDAALGLEFLGMTSPEVEEGVAAIRDRRPAAFDPKSSL